MKSTAHEILGLEQKPDQNGIKARYRELVKRYHPDANHGDPTAEWIFKRVQWAYDELSAGPDNRPLEPRPAGNRATHRTRRRDRKENPSDRNARANRHTSKHAPNRFTDPEELFWVQIAVTTGIAAGWFAGTIGITNTLHQWLAILGATLAVSSIRMVTR